MGLIALNRSLILMLDIRNDTRKIITTLKSVYKKLLCEITSY